MSVIMTLRTRGDAKALEEQAAANPQMLQSIIDKAHGHGLIGHRFFASDDGQIMVIDEWPDAASFQAFFAEAAGEIEPMMRNAGVTDQPEIVFWRRLETGDDVGWGA